MSGLILPTRRFFLTGLIAAPAVIAANKLMPVKSIITTEEFDLAVGQTAWVLISNGGSPIWGLRSTMERMYYENNTKRYVDKTITPPDFKTQILQEVMLPERTNYKKVHIGTELLKIQPARIISS